MQTYVSTFTVKIITWLVGQNDIINESTSSFIEQLAKVEIED